MHASGSYGSSPFLFFPSLFLCASAPLIALLQVIGVDQLDFYGHHRSRVSLGANPLPKGHHLLNLRNSLVWPKFAYVESPEQL